MTTLILIAFAVCCLIVAFSLIVACVHLFNGERREAGDWFFRAATAAVISVFNIVLLKGLP